MPSICVEHGSAESPLKAVFWAPGATFVATKGRKSDPLGRERLCVGERGRGISACASEDGPASGPAAAGRALPHRCSAAAASCTILRGRRATTPLRAPPACAATSGRRNSPDAPPAPRPRFFSIKAMAALPKRSTSGQAFSGRLRRLGLDHVMRLHKAAHPLDHLLGRERLLHRFLRVEPAAGLVVAEAPHHRPRDQLVGNGGLFLHAPQHEPAGRGRSGIQVVDLHVVAEQLGLEAGCSQRCALSFASSRRGSVPKPSWSGPTLSRIKGQDCQQLLDARGA